MKVIVADLGQIEARLCAFVCNCAPLLDQFANKLDPYSLLAADIFGRKVNRKLAGTPDEAMGFIGKTGILGLGYNAGAPRFHKMVNTDARKFGVDLALIGGFDMARSQRTVDTYRSKYRDIPNTWYELQGIIQTAWVGTSGECQWRPTIRIGRGIVKIDGALPLCYGDPKLDHETGDYTFRFGKERHKLYGGKLLENIVQYLARNVVMHAAVRLADRGLRFALQSHDELVFIVPDDEVEAAGKVILEEMIRRPSWAPDLPLTVDIGVGNSYGEAK